VSEAVYPGLVRGEPTANDATRPSRPLVSVLIPVHNGADYLDECVDSVVSQTYGSWELLIVDNASTDATREIAAVRAASDPRITLAARDEFIDVVASFNRAFRLMPAAARYCKPLSADDLLLPDCLELMVDLAERHPEVGLVSAHRLQGETVDFHGIPAGVDVLCGADVCRATLLGGVWAFGSSTSTMIRADLVRGRDPFYDPAYLHADLAACFAVLQSSSFGFVDKRLTYTRRHAATVTSQVSGLMTHDAEMIRMYQQFGPVYLEPSEYERRLAVLLAAYAFGLARRPRRFAARPVRAYHAAFFRGVLASVSPAQLARGFVRQARRMVGGSRRNGAALLAARYGRR
jgi:glycosyltransferase involved in cell wall biosynthesis